MVTTNLTSNLESEKLCACVEEQAGVGERVLLQGFLEGKL